MWSFHALSRHTTLPFLSVFTTPETCWIPSFWTFMETSLHRCNWLNHWPLAIDLTSSPSPSLEVRRMGLKFQCSNNLAGSPGILTPSLVLSSSHLINIIKDFYHSHHLGYSKGLRSTMPETGWRQNMYFIIMHHNITCFIPFHCLIFCHMDKPHFIYPFISW